MESEYDRSRLGVESKHNRSRIRLESVEGTSRLDAQELRGEDAGPDEGRTITFVPDFTRFGPLAAREAASETVDDIRTDCRRE